MTVEECIGSSLQQTSNKKSILKREIHYYHCVRSREWNACHVASTESIGGGWIASQVMSVPLRLHQRSPSIISSSLLTHRPLVHHIDHWVLAREAMHASTQWHVPSNSAGTVRDALFCFSFLITPAIATGSIYTWTCSIDKLWILIV